MKPIKRNPATRPLRCRKYLDYLISDGVCIICGRSGCDPCHGPVSGMASKGADNEAVPMCREHHQEQHRLTWPNFEIKHRFKRTVMAAWWWARYQQKKLGRVA